MATAEQYANWLIANEGKKGSQEFETVAQAYKLVRRAPAAPPVADKPSDPTEGQGFFSNAAAGLGKAMVDTGRGIRQLGSYVGIGDKDAIQAEIDEAKRLDAPLMNTGGGVVGNVAGHVGMALAPGGALMAAGRAAPAAGAVGKALLTAPSTLRGAATSAAVGAAQAGIQPVASDESRAGNIAVGGVGGALIPAAGMALGGLKGAVEPLYEGGRQAILGRALRSAAGPNADVAAANMRGAQPLVPGSMPTAADVAQSPGIAAMQRAAAAVDPEAYGQRAIQNNEARVAELFDLAGTSGARTSAANARESTAGRLYQQAYDEGIDLSRFEAGKAPFALAQALKDKSVEKPASSLLSRIKAMGGIKNAEGTMRDITGETRTGAGVKGIAPGLFNKSGVGLDDLAIRLREDGYLIPEDAVDGGVQVLKDMIRDEIQGTGKHYSGGEMDAIFAKMAAKRQGPMPEIPKNATRATDKLTALLERPALKDAMTQARVLARNEGVKLETEAGTVKGLDYVKRALDDQIAGANGNEKRILTTLKQSLLEHLDDLSPKYAQARQTYRDMSRPINQMDIAQEIADKAIRPLDNSITPAALARALSDDTAARATGFEGATLANTLEPAQLARLNAIKTDLARSAFAQNAGRGSGSDTVQKLSMANLMQRSGLPVGVTNLPGLGRVGNFAYSQADELMRRRLAQALLNPKETAQLMGAGMTRPQIQALSQALRAGGTALATGGAASLVNAQ